MKVTPYVGTYGLSEDNDRKLTELQQAFPGLLRTPIYDHAIGLARALASAGGGTVCQHFNAVVQGLLDHYGQSSQRLAA